MIANDAKIPSMPPKTTDFKYPLHPINSKPEVLKAHFNLGFSEADDYFYFDIKVTSAD